MDEIFERINQVEVERVYRIIGVLEKTARAIEGELVPQDTRREAALETPRAVDGHGRDRRSGAWRVGVEHRPRSLARAALPTALAGASC